MQKRLLCCLLMGIHICGGAQAPVWQKVSGVLSTPWADTLQPQHVWQQYPRPQWERSQWQCLNGLWSYSLQPVAANAAPPTAWQGHILVPFAIEAALSGVCRTVGADSLLWYRRSFEVPARRGQQRTILHFGAVDWRATVFVNGRQVGVHEGGYDPFSFDITPYLQKGTAQELMVQVWDPADAGPQPRGKQVKRPEGIWYTPVTGIWQTVWLEQLPESHIAHARFETDIDAGTVTVHTQLAGPAVPTDDLRIRIAGVDSLYTIPPGASLTIKLPYKRLWWPHDPHLYYCTLSLWRAGQAVDEVKSYFALRKVSMAPDTRGIQRMLLNHQFIFQYGPLDQGWWPDGLYTAPCDAALAYDIEQTKAMGFNMIRKHVKVEPARWYYHADRLGMLVWQDMPSGDLGNRWESRPGIIGLGTDKNRSPQSEAIFRKEWAAIMNSLLHFPSIVVWVPFNEAWGQFKTRDITTWTMQHDPTRLVNSASGGNFEPVGHILDLHNYPEPVMPDAAVYGLRQSLVLGEFGGLGLPVEGHTWQQKNNWGYQSFQDAKALQQRYSDFIYRLPAFIRQGLSAAVYTQTTDVEVEVNGLMTYDRRVIKIPVDTLRQLHSVLWEE